jgi:hypothetical protein
MRATHAPLPKHWQDKATLILALALAVSPWLLGYSDLSVATGNAVVIAVLWAAGAALMFVLRAPTPDFFVAFFAFWLAMSPRILGFADRIVPSVTAYALGAAVVVFALWASVLRAHDLQADGGNIVGFTPPAQPPAKPDGHKKAA